MKKQKLSKSVSVLPNHKQLKKRGAKSSPQSSKMKSKNLDNSHYNHQKNHASSVNDPHYIQSTKHSSSFSDDEHQRKLTFNESTVLIAFILVIITLFVITMAMFKLAGSIHSLSERLYNLEDLLTKIPKNCENQPE